MKRISDEILFCRLQHAGNRQNAGLASLLPVMAEGLQAIPRRKRVPVMAQFSRFKFAQADKRRYKCGNQQILHSQRIVLNSHLQQWQGWKLRRVRHQQTFTVPVSAKQARAFPRKSAAGKARRNSTPDRIRRLLRKQGKDAMVMALQGVEHGFGAQFSVERSPRARKTAASGRASQILEVQCQPGQVPHADPTNPKRPCIYVCLHSV